MNGHTKVASYPQSIQENGYLNSLPITSGSSHYQQWGVTLANGYNYHQPAPIQKAPNFRRALSMPVQNLQNYSVQPHVPQPYYNTGQYNGFQPQFPQQQLPPQQFPLWLDQRHTQSPVAYVAPMPVVQHPQPTADQPDSPHSLAGARPGTELPATSPEGETLKPTSDLAILMDPDFLPLAMKLGRIDKQLIQRVLQELPEKVNFDFDYWFTVTVNKQASTEHQLSSLLFFMTRHKISVQEFCEAMGRAGYHSREALLDLVAASALLREPLPLLQKSDYQELRVGLFTLFSRGWDKLLGQSPGGQVMALKKKFEEVDAETLEEIANHKADVFLESPLLKDKPLIALVKFLAASHDTGLCKFVLESLRGDTGKEEVKKPLVSPFSPALQRLEKTYKTKRHYSQLRRDAVALLNPEFKSLRRQLFLNLDDRAIKVLTSHLPPHRQEALRCAYSDVKGESLQNITQQRAELMLTEMEGCGIRIIDLIACLEESGDEVMKQCAEILRSHILSLPVNKKGVLLENVSNSESDEEDDTPLADKPVSELLNGFQNKYFKALFLFSISGPAWGAVLAELTPPHRGLLVSHVTKMQQQGDVENDDEVASTLLTSLADGGITVERFSDLLVKATPYEPSFARAAKALKTWAQIAIKESFPPPKPAV